VRRWFSALVLLTLMGGGAYLLMRSEPRQLPVRVVTVDGEVNQLSHGRLQEVVLEHLKGGILTQDLAELKAAVEDLPWVHTASLRRHWPDRLELAVEEHVALARWGRDGLVTSEGTVFRPEDGDLPRGLVVLSGLDEQAPEVVARFLDWGSRLRALGLRIEELSLDARRAWTLRCSTGFTLALGTSRVDERMARFLRTYPKLVAAGAPLLVDMRYSNGLAIRWSEEGVDGQGLSAEEAAKSAQLKTRALRPSRS
jgi:cell division protein FtsQ